MTFSILLQGKKNLTYIDFTLSVNKIVKKQIIKKINKERRFAAI